MLQALELAEQQRQQHPLSNLRVAILGGEALVVLDGIEAPLPPRVLTALRAAEEERANGDNKVTSDEVATPGHKRQKLGDGKENEEEKVQDGDGDGDGDDDMEDGGGAVVAAM